MPQKPAGGVSPSSAPISTSQLTEVTSPAASPDLLNDRTLPIAHRIELYTDGETKEILRLQDESAKLESTDAPQALLILQQSISRGDALKTFLLRGERELKTRDAISDLKNSRDPKIREQAAKDLSGEKAPEAVGVLLENGLYDKEPAVRLASVQSIADTKDPQYHRALFAYVLSEEDSLLQASAARFLIGTEDQKILEDCRSLWLGSRLGSISSSVKSAGRAAGIIMQSTSDRRTLDCLCNIAAYGPVPDPGCRLYGPQYHTFEAFKILGGTKDPEARRRLSELVLTSDSPSRVEFAAEALQGTDDPVILGALLEAGFSCRNELTARARAAAGAFRGIEHQPTVDRLCEALKDENRGVQLFAALALRDTGAPKAQLALHERYLRTWDREVKVAVVSALKKVTNSGMLLDICKRGIKSGDPDLVDATVAVLQGKGVKAVTQWLVETGLKSWTPAVRVAAAKALKGTEDQQAQRALLDGALNDHNQRVREACAASLERSTRPEIKAALKDAGF